MVGYNVTLEVPFYLLSSIKTPRREMIEAQRMSEEIYELWGGSL